MLVQISGKKNEETLTITSRDVEEVFGKEHFNVLRYIESLGCTEGFRKLNFEASEYKMLQVTY